MPRQLPDAFCDAMKPLLGEEWPAFFRAMSEDAPLRGLRVNTLRCSADAFASLSPWPLTPSPLCPDGFRIGADCPAGKHPFHAAGVYYLQEPAAMTAALALPLKKGMRVLDLCAAPGGKSTHAAALLAPYGGFLAANECVADRARILASNIERLGIANACVLSGMPDALAERCPAMFDAVLVDAPCSGEGMFRREPRAIPEWNPAHVRTCARRQSLILDAAAAMTAPDGYIVYSTCTLNPLENEGVCARFLHSHPGWELAPVSHAASLPHGRPEWLASVPELAEYAGRDDLRRTVRLMPHLTPGEGHFVALLHKTLSAADPLPDRENPPLPENALRKPDREEAAAFASMWRDCMDAPLPDAEALRVRGEYMYIVRPEAAALPGMVLPGIQAAHLCRARAAQAKASKKTSKWMDHETAMRRTSSSGALRAEPAHALVMAYPVSWRSRLPLDAEAPLTDAFLRGQAIPADASCTGWTAVCIRTAAGDFPLGLAKVSGGLAKNHLPKGLRFL